jgi:hypothetical protein
MANSQRAFTAALRRDFFQKLMGGLEFAAFGFRAFSLSGHQLTAESLD